MTSTEVYTVAPEMLPVDDRLKLVRFSAQDAEATYRLIQDNLDFLSLTMPWMLDFTPEIAQESLRLQEKKTLAGKSAPYKVMNEGKFVGAVNLRGREGTTAEMGYWGSRSVARQQIMSKAAHRLVRHAFESGLDSLWLEIGAQNVASQRFAEGLHARHVCMTEPTDETQEVEQLWKIYKYEYQTAES